VLDLLKCELAVDLTHRQTVRVQPSQQATVTTLPPPAAPLHFLQPSEPRLGPDRARPPPTGSKWAMARRESGQSWTHLCPASVLRAGRETGRADSCQ
jgi:hypothetical protein